MVFLFPVSICLSSNQPRVQIFNSIAEQKYHVSINPDVAGNPEKSRGIGAEKTPARLRCQVFSHLISYIYKKTPLRHRFTLIVYRK